MPASDEDPVCQIAAAYASNGFHQALLLIEVLVCALTLTLTGVAVSKTAYSKVAVHPNMKVSIERYDFVSEYRFKIIYGCIIVICCTYSSALTVGNVRFLVGRCVAKLSCTFFQAVYWFHGDSCQLPATVAFGLVVTLPWAVYLVGCPLCHLAASLERLWATVRATTYEKSDHKYGMTVAALIVSHQEFL